MSELSSLTRPKLRSRRGRAMSAILSVANAAAGTYAATGAYIVVSHATRPVHALLAVLIALLAVLCFVGAFVAAYDQMSNREEIQYVKALEQHYSAELADLNARYEKLSEETRAYRVEKAVAEKRGQHLHLMRVQVPAPTPDVVSRARSAAQPQAEIDADDESGNT